MSYHDCTIPRTELPVQSIAKTTCSKKIAQPDRLFVKQENIQEERWLSIYKPPQTNRTDKVCMENQGMVKEHKAQNTIAVHWCQCSSEELLTFWLTTEQVENWPSDIALLISRITVQVTLPWRVQTFVREHEKPKTCANKNIPSWQNIEHNFGNTCFQSLSCDLQNKSHYIHIHLCRMVSPETI